MFVDIVEKMSQQGIFSKFNLRPFMCGSATTQYAQAIKGRLRRCFAEAIIEERFLGAHEMANIYAQSRLNFHPCTYDAYGMTIVEAASQGTPSVVHVGDSVGATELFEEGCLFQVDMAEAASSLAARIEVLLGNASNLQTVGARAARCARGYDEEENAKILARVVTNAVQRPE